MGCAITAKGNSGIPETLEMARAVWTNPSVMIAVAAMPAFSTVTASCKLHDEQLPQSPTPEMTASHRLAAAIISAGAGRLASGFLKRSTLVTPYWERRICSIWAKNSRPFGLPLSNNPIEHPVRDARRLGVTTVEMDSSKVGSRTRIVIRTRSYSVDISIPFVTARPFEPNQGGMTAPNPPAGPPAATISRSLGS